jgi:hypothetical protein
MSVVEISVRGSGVLSDDLLIYRDDADRKKNDVE